MKTQVVARGSNSVQATPQSLENFYLLCEPEEKIARLVEFIKVRVPHIISLARIILLVAHIISLAGVCGLRGKWNLTGPG